MRAVLITLALVAAAMITPAQAWSKCSICEELVEELISKGGCDAGEALCDFAPPPWDVVCEGIFDCCCELLMHFIQEHIGDPKDICDHVHMCSTLSKGEIMMELMQKAKAHYGVAGGPMMPPQLAATLSGVTWDAKMNFNTSYAATVYDDFTQHTRRADVSTFGVRGTRWIEKANTNAPEMIEQLNGGNCTQRSIYAGAPFAAEADFWVNATYEGQEMRSLIGPVDKFTRFAPQGYFVGYFRPWDKRPAEVWAFYKSHFRTVEVMSGTQDSFSASELLPCSPTKNG